MSTRPKLTRRTADRFLDRRDGVSAHPVSALLDAAGAAEGVGELPGEAVALVQFRAGAHLAPVKQPTAARTRKLLAAPASAVVAVGVLVTGGGVALAASNGALDGVDIPFTDHDNRSDKAPDAPSATNPGQTNATNGPRSGTGTNAPGTGSSATPKAELRGLCRAFQAGAYKDDKKSPAFRSLAAAAGGVDQVAQFCTNLIGPPKAQPTRPAKPTQAATPNPGAQPTARPSRPAKPTAAATPAAPTQKAQPTTGPRAAAE